MEKILIQLEKTISNARAAVKYNINKLIPRPMVRWTIFSCTYLFFMLRVLIMQKYFLVAYMSSIYILYGFVSFCSPNDDSIPCALEDFDDFDVSNIPTNTIEEIEDYKPFDRKLPDYKYWESSMICLCFSILATLFDVFNFTVYAPILIIYFLIMCISVIRNIYLHSKKFNYNPLDFGKKVKY